MTPEYFGLVVGMGLVTYIPRWLPLMLLTRKQLPHWLVTWLDLIPAAILSALLMPALLVEDATLKLDLFRPELWVALPTFLFALRTQSLGGTVVVGMALFWAAGKVFQ